MKVGIIGFGSRIQELLRTVYELELGVEVAAICDVRNDEIKQSVKMEGLDMTKVAFFEDADEMLDSIKLDGVMVGTRCFLHTAMAIKVLKRDIALFLEKPVATNMEDLKILKKAYEESKSKVLVSFPLRASLIVDKVKEIVDSGMLGTIEHVQAVNNVPYGGVYFHGWYRDDSITGGLYFAKTTHDFDCINYLLGTKPVEICAMSSKRVFLGEKQAGLQCPDCDEKETCSEGPFVQKHFAYDDPWGNMCCFAKDVGNEDSGSILIRYSSGMHVSYSQNFFARKGAAARGARLLGYKGTVEFDWYKSEIKVFMHNTPREEHYRFDIPAAGHFGGDKSLAYNFINVMRGTELPMATLEDGILSTLMCISAQKSAATRQFCEIEWE